MAGNWLKMRTDLPTHPKVVRISSALNADRLRVVGALFAVWSLFDAHSEDGELDGYTLEVLDGLIGFPGFSAAMRDVAWIEERGNSLVAPRFSEHNGQSAKRRAQESERKRDARNVSASDADKKRTREEKRRSNTPLIPPAGGGAEFDEFVAEFPEAKRIKTEEARREFAAVLAEGGVTAAQLLHAIRRQAGIQADQWARERGRFAPTPARWLRERRWVDTDSPGTPDAWQQSRSGIEAMGEKLGLGRWAEAEFNRGSGESFPAYKDRVVAAAGNAGHSFSLHH